MRGVAVSEETIKVNNSSTASTRRPEPEYVLKVDNCNDIDKKEDLQKASNSNPQNLPMVVKKKTHKYRGLLILVFIFLISFLVSASLGYKAVFMLFELK